MLAPTERRCYAVAFVSAIELGNTSERLKSEPIEATDARRARALLPSQPRGVIS